MRAGGKKASSILDYVINYMVRAHGQVIKVSGLEFYRASTATSALYLIFPPRADAGRSRTPFSQRRERLDNRAEVCGPLLRARREITSAIRQHSSGGPPEILRLVLHNPLGLKVP